ncbi:hemagglutinin repeat-containing protein [Vogesella amnigena]|uniref:Hemagglutinin repeat-containing protein n=1 Tax=Vogesella amnigena TaxID=1507449 RepID=A0ABV7TXK2_9NEIS
MNKHLYRIVFNKARGLLMVVAENVASHGKASAGTTAASGRSVPLCLALRPVCFSLLVASGLVHAMPSATQVVADGNAPKTQQPTILNTANGVPQVNIQTPSAAGVSRNSYTQFDVGQQGVILNNARGSAQTQLGGWVAGNPWLAAGTARVILNEVNSSLPSQLRGYVEVAGDRAQVVIANPAGISCDGCGFINANRATLTTGSPILNNGSLEGYRVQQGNITISGVGLDGRQAEYTDLLARAIQVNAGIWATQLRVHSGAGQSNADLSQTSALLAANTSPAPAYSLDVAALGGMYAGKIWLVGTEHGLGARFVGQLGAAAGEIVVRQDGEISNSGKLAATGDIQVQASAGIQNSGTVSAQGDITLQTAATFDNSGMVIAGGNADIRALQLDNQQGATLGAVGNTNLAASGMENSGSVQAGASLQLTADALDNRASGEISAASTQLTLSNNLTNRGLIDGEQTRLSAATLNNLGSGRIYGDQLAIAAGTLNNLSENGVAPTIAARTQLDIGAGTVNNREHALIFSAGDMAFGGALDAGFHATGLAGSINNNSASIEALGKLAIAAHTINNTNEHFATEVLPVGTPEHIIEYQGSGSPNRYRPGDPGVYIFNDESDHLMTPEGPFETWSQYDYTRSIQETTITQTDPGKITAGGDMSLTADTLRNDKSHIIAGGQLTANVTDLQNIDVTGQHYVTDIGVVTNYWRDHQKGRDSTGSSTSTYQPPVAISDISLAPFRYQQNSQPPASGTKIGDLGTLTVPDSSLYHLSSDPKLGYLVETDPRFSNYRQWLGSDYMLAALSVDPTSVQKRLGDGFYEQKLLREQVAQLTGRRFLDGYASDQAQYQALMDQGITVAKAWSLRPGVALSAQQVAQLTSDIVWLVEQDVTLPDGRTAKALVPQLYLRPGRTDLASSGALIAGDSLNLQLRGQLDNQGTLAGRRLLTLTADTVNNLGGRITGNDVLAAARNDLNNIGGSIDAGNSLQVTAGRDLNLTSTTRSNSNAQGSETHLNRVAGLYVTNPSGSTLVASAGRNLHLTAADIGNSGSGSTQLAAGNDLVLDTITTSQQQHIVWDDNNQRRDSSSQDIGSQVHAKGDIALLAGHDLTARAANVGSEQGAVQARAGNDIQLTAGSRRQTVDEAHQHTGSSSAFSSTTISTRDSLDQTQAVATTLSGNTTSLQAGRDIAVSGSNVVSTAGTALQAGRDIAITAATDTLSQQHDRAESQSGLFSGGGLGFTLGTRQQSVDQRGSSTQAAAATIGSTQGDVTLQAGQHYQQSGSHVLAPQGNIDIAAKQIDISAAQQHSQTTTDTRFKQNGLSVAISNPVVSALQTGQQMQQAASQTSDSRMQTLAAATTALASKNAYDAVSQNPAQAGGINLSISVGSSQSQSHSEQQQDSSSASTLRAGGNLSLRATGDGQHSNLTVQGSDIQAAGNVSLQADNQIQLLAAQHSASQHSTNSGSSASLGVSIGPVGPQLNVSASGNRGNADGSDTSWRNTHIDAGQQLTLQSGGDTTLKGAVASGKQITAKVGGDLKLESLQDSSHYVSKQQSQGGSLSVGAGVVSGSVNIGNSKLGSDYASVTEQTGLTAGDGGFQLQVQGNTDLKGAVISSSEQAVRDGKNQLSTGTLTHSDIDNHASYSGQSVSLGGGYSSNGSGVGKNQQGQASSDGSQTPGSSLPSLNGLSATAPLAMNANGSSSSTTQSGISGGAIEIRDSQQQQTLNGQTAEQTVAGLNRDVETGQDSTHALKPIFNEQELKAGFEVVGALQRETATFLNNRALEKDHVQQQIDAELEKPAGQRDAARLEALTSQQQANQIWAMGGIGHTVLTALTAAAGGNISATDSAFFQAMAVNYLQSLGAQEIKHLADALDSEVARAALQALNACAGAALQGRGCGGAAAGAGAAVVLNNLLNQVNGQSGPLSAEEREARSNLLTSLISGIAGASGGDASSAGNAANIEMRNNALMLIPLALELVDKGITAYDAWQLDKALREGRNEDAKEIAAGIAIGLATEAVPGNKVLQKIGQVLGKSGKAGEEVARAAAEIVAKREQLASQSVDFAKGISDLPPGERVAKIKEIVPQVVNAYGWKRDKQLEKLNPGRAVYKAPDGKIYSLDTQHGAWERINPKNGAHEGEYKMLNPLELVERSVDTSGRHNLKVK